jgi:hypothetical protein
MIHNGGNRDWIGHCRAMHVAIREANNPETRVARPTLRPNWHIGHCALNVVLSWLLQMEPVQRTIRDHQKESLCKDSTDHWYWQLIYFLPCIDRALRNFIEPISNAQDLRTIIATATSHIHVLKDLDGTKIGHRIRSMTAETMFSIEKPLLVWRQHMIGDMRSQLIECKTEIIRHAECLLQRTAKAQHRLRRDAIALPWGVQEIQTVSAVSHEILNHTNRMMISRMKAQGYIMACEDIRGNTSVTWAEALLNAPTWPCGTELTSEEED